MLHESTAITARDLLNTTSQLFGNNFHQALLDSKTRDFLAKRTKTDPTIQKLLWELIIASRYEPSIAKAAANAATVLNYAGISFTGRNLRGIRIPGADLSGVSANLADFSGADLTNVNLENASLAYAKFIGTCLDGIQLNERPFLSTKYCPTALTCSPNGQKLAIGDEEGFVYINSTIDQQKTNHCQLTDKVAALQFHSDSKQLNALTIRNRFVTLWDGIEGKPLRVFTGHTVLTSPVRFSPNGQWIASASQDNTLCLWNIEQGKLYTLRKHHQRICDFSIFSTSKRLVSASEDNTICLWNIETEELLKTYKKNFKGCITTISIAPNDQWFALGYADGTIRVLETDSGELLHTLEGHSHRIHTISTSSNGKWLVSGSEDSSLCLWDATTGTLLKTYRKHATGIQVTSFSLNNQQIVSASKNGTIHFWDTTITPQPSITWQKPLPLPKQQETSSNDKWIVSLGKHKKDQLVIYVFSKKGKLLNTLKGHTDIIHTVALSPDGQWAASTSQDKTVRLWNLHTGKCCLILRHFSYPITHLQWNTQGLFAYDKKGGVYYWRTQITVNINEIWNSTSVSQIHLLLQWTNRPYLYCEGLDLSQAIGLSPSNLWVFRQHGAIGQVSDQSHSSVLQYRNTVEHYVGDSCKSLFAHTQKGDSLLLTRRNWALSLAHKKIPEAKQHTILFLEGVNNDGYRVLKKIEVSLKQDNLTGEKEQDQKIQVTLDYQSPQATQALLLECRIRSEAITRSQADKLLALIQQAIQRNTHPHHPENICEKWLKAIGVYFLKSSTHSNQTLFLNKTPSNPSINLFSHFSQLTRSEGIVAIVRSNVTIKEKTTTYLVIANYLQKGLLKCHFYQLRPLPRNPQQSFLFNVSFRCKDCEKKTILWKILGKEHCIEAMKIRPLTDIQRLQQHLQNEIQHFSWMESDKEQAAQWLQEKLNWFEKNSSNTPPRQLDSVKPSLKPVTNPFTRRNLRYNYPALLLIRKTQPHNNHHIFLVTLEYLKEGLVKATRYDLIEGRNKGEAAIKTAVAYSSPDDNYLKALLQKALLQCKIKQCVYRVSHITSPTLDRLDYQMQKATLHPPLYHNRGTQKEAENCISFSIDHFKDCLQQSLPHLKQQLEQPDLNPTTKEMLMNFKKEAETHLERLGKLRQGCCIGYLPYSVLPNKRRLASVEACELIATRSLSIRSSA